jgi:hypothetical protein
MGEDLYTLFPKPRFIAPTRKSGDIVDGELENFIRVVSVDM